MTLSTNLVAGLSSGFDWRSMIDQLIAVEHKRVELVTDQKTEYELKLSEWQSFNSTLLSLKTAAEGLKDPKDFYLYTASMSTNSSTVNAEDLLSVSTDTTAATGSYEVKVTSLAQAQKLSSNPFTSKTAELGSSYAGDIVINGKALTISATDSLADVATNINSLNTGTDPIGVSAIVINYGTNDYRLVLTSDSTGADGISLLNGSSTSLVQKFGWKDSAPSNNIETIKNSITNGAQSDRFSAPDVTVYSLLGLSSSRSASVTINNQAVTIDLSNSLTQIKDNIDALTGVSASVVSEVVDGATYYRLQIEGPPDFGTNATDFADTDNILNTLGVIDFTSTDVSGKVSGKSMTTEGAYITADILLKDIDGYNTFTSGGNPGGDYITMTGTTTGGSGLGAGVNFDISSTTTVQDLLDAIESNYGDVIAYVTSDGKIRVDDLTGGANLVVNLTDHINDANSELEFVESDADFAATAAESARKKQIISAADATLLVDGVQVTSSENIIDNVITGVTLNLVKADSDTTVTLNFERDIDAVKANIENFISKYNEVTSYINAQFSYNEESETTGGVLFGDGTLYSVKSDLTSLLTQTIWGVDSEFSIMGLVGINMDNDMQLSIDDAKLTGYLKTNFNDIKSLFVGQGTTDTSTLSYVGHSRDTEANEYQVHIDTAATRGTETGDVDLVTSGLANDVTLTITQGNSTATIALSQNTELDDIKNEINTELDTEYAETLVSDQQLKEDDDTTYITSGTTWDNIYNTTLQDTDVIEFSGTTRSGTTVSGSYTISNVATDTVQGLLSAIESAFSSEVTASIDTSGRVVLTDKYVGTSQLSLDITEPAGRGLNFGTIDVTALAGDGSQEGRHAMAITATNSGNYLVLRSDDYGSTSFDISQSTTGLGLTDGTVTGLDVTGTIGGEAATGSGQVLTGNDGNVNTDGLSVKYSGTSNDTDAGFITLTLGVAELFDRVLFNITDSYDGYVAFKKDSLKDSIDSFETKTDQMEARLDLKMEYMIKKFVAMELALSKIQNQSQWLAGQIEASFGGWG